MTKLLVSCVGAYNDSGIGSGGLLLVDTINRKIDVIDRIDCTGLSVYKNKVFRYARGIRKLVSFNKDGLTGSYNLQRAKDIHDVKVSNQEIKVVSTGSNSILVYDEWGALKSSFNPGGTDDAWHLNCIEEYQGNLYFTAFGNFQTHREWNGKAKESGFIYSVNQKKAIVEKLSGPHNPRVMNEKWWVCNSHDGTLNIYHLEKGELEHTIDLGGFTRGLLQTEDVVWAGVNANRKAVGDTSGKVVAVNPTTYQLEDEIKLPMPEIYDIVEIDRSLYNAILADKGKFSLEAKDSRTEVENFVNQISLMEDQLIELRNRLRKQSFDQRIRRKLKSFLK